MVDSSERICPAEVISYPIASSDSSASSIDFQ
jgi:hypothetical protein